MSTNLFEKLCGSTKSKTYLIKKTQVKLKVLSQADTDEVMRIVSGMVAGDDYVGKVTIMKRPTLARAIVEIDGKPIEAHNEIVNGVKSRREVNPSESAEISNKIVIEEFLGKFPSGMIDLLYSAYNELKAEDDKENDALKKSWFQGSEDQFGK